METQAIQNNQSQQPEQPQEQDQAQPEVKQPEPKSQASQKPTSYQKTDNPAVNAALGIISRAGIDPSNSVSYRGNKWP